MTLCNKFQVSGFGCEGRSFRVQGRTFSSIFGLEYLHTTTMEARTKSDENAMAFMALMFLCHFFLFGMSEL